MRRAGDELPERMKVRERRARGIVVMRGAIMHVAGDEDDVADALVADELEQRRNLELAAERRPLVAVGDGLEQRAVSHREAERHVAGDDLPRRA